MRSHSGRRRVSTPAWSSASNTGIAPRPARSRATKASRVSASHATSPMVCERSSDARSNGACSSAAAAAARTTSAPSRYESAANATRPSRSTTPLPRSRSRRDSLPPGPRSVSARRAKTSATSQETVRAAAASSRTSASASAVPVSTATASCSWSVSTSDRLPVTRWSATRASSRRSLAAPSRAGSPGRRYPWSTSARNPPGSPSVHPAHDSDWRSRSPPPASLRSGSSFSESRPNRWRRASAPACRLSTRRARRRTARPRMRPTRPANSSLSPATRRASRVAVNACRSRSASATSCFTVFMACPSTNPASQSGYQRRSAAPATSAAASCRSTTSTSDPGHSSARPYDPTATRAKRPSTSPPTALANERLSDSSSRSESARPNAAPRRVRSSTRRSRAARSSETVAGSEGVGPGLPGPDPPDVLDGHDPYLAVADLPRASRFDELLDDPVDVAVVDEDLDPHLGHEVDGVLGPPVHLGVAALAPEPLHVGDGEPLHAEILHHVLHVVDPERLDDAHDELHESLDPPWSAALTRDRARSRSPNAERGRDRSPR